MKCRHGGFRQLCTFVEYAPGVEAKWIDTHQDTGEPIRKVLVAAHRCHDCGAWLSVGASADDSDQVRVELRAAEIVATNYAVWPEAFGVEAYRDGCLPEPTGPREHHPAWHAGWLAAVILGHDVAIVAHDKEQG